MRWVPGHRILDEDMTPEDLVNLCMFHLSHADFNVQKENFDPHMSLLTPLNLLSGFHSEPTKYLSRLQKEISVPLPIPRKNPFSALQIHSTRSHLQHTSLSPFCHAKRKTSQTSPPSFFPSFTFLEIHPPSSTILFVFVLFRLDFLRPSTGGPITRLCLRRPLSSLSPSGLRVISAAVLAESC